MLEKALELLNIFKDNGYEAYLVGGFVRDYILNKKSYDIDICTNATPMEIKKIFNDVSLPFEGYGSVHLTYKKISFEITTYRMDLEYKNKRNPSKIVYTDKLFIDLKRRDFTMNTLCMDSCGNVLDLLNGSYDIDNKIIKTVGDADKRIKEDALRILRAIRFATELDFKLDEKLEEAIINNKEDLLELSYFRKKQELNKIFSSYNAMYGIGLLKRFGLSKYLGINLNHEIIKTTDPIGIWAQVKPDCRYQFTNNEKKYIISIQNVIMQNKIDDITLYNEGNYVCFIASQILRIDSVNIYDRFDSLPIKKIKDIKIKPTDIISMLNLQDKSKLKVILKDIEEKILNRTLINEENKLREYIFNKYCDKI